MGRSLARDVLLEFRPGPKRELQLLLEFANKLTLFPEAVTAADYAPFHLAGLNPAAVVQGILIVVGFNLINRVADGFHFDTPSEGDCLLSARFLRFFGYRYLAEPRLRSRSAPWMRMPNSAHSERGDAYIAVLVGSTRRWLRFLVCLGSQVPPTASDIRKRVWQKVLDDPATITPDDLVALEEHGCSQADIFNLVLGAASNAALLRLDAGLRAMSACRRTSNAACTSSQVYAGRNESSERRF